MEQADVCSRGWRWAEGTLRIGAACGLLYGIYAVAREAVAAWYTRQESLQGLRLAIRWDPGNPEYDLELARALQISPENADPKEIISVLERATRLAPNRAEIWAELGSAYEWAGRIEEARRAYERARRLFPRSPNINWRLGNFYIRAGDIREALLAFQPTLLGDPEMRSAAFDLAWRAEIPADQILSEMIPQKQEVLFAYLDYLLDKHHLDEAGRVWARILSLPNPFDPRASFHYCDVLIQNHRLEELKAVWAALAQRNPSATHSRPADENLINNANFEQEILNGGLDWRVVPVEGVAVGLDTQTRFASIPSLAIRFDGQRNPPYGQVFQFIPVQPNTHYRFSGSMRTEGITSDSGPRFEIDDAYDRARLSLFTENLVGTSNWTLQELDFTTGPDTRLLIVRVVRAASRKFDNRIAGTVWISHVRLNVVRSRPEAHTLSNRPARGAPQRPARSRG